MTNNPEKLAAFGELVMGLFESYDEYVKLTDGHPLSDCIQFDEASVNFNRSEDGKNFILILRENSDDQENEDDD